MSLAVLRATAKLMADSPSLGGGGIFPLEDQQSALLLPRRRAKPVEATLGLSRSLAVKPNQLYRQPMDQPSRTPSQSLSLA